MVFTDVTEYSYALLAKKITNHRDDKMGNAKKFLDNFKKELKKRKTKEANKNKAKFVDRRIRMAVFANMSPVEQDELKDLGYKIHGDINYGRSISSHLISSVPVDLNKIRLDN